MEKGIDKPRHIIIGGGTAGVILAHQLILKGCSVILIERGDIDVKSMDKEDFWTYLCNDECHSTSTRSIPQSHLYNRSIKYPAGHGLGGTSTINAMLHDIGHVSVFDRFWPKDWNSAKIIEYERKLDALVPYNQVESSGSFKGILEGVANLPPHQVCEGKRRWAHRSLLRQAWIDEGKLVLIKNEVVKINIVENRAVSVVLAGIKEEVTPSGGGDIILSCGTFGTPLLLYRSGVHSIHNPSNSNKKVVDIGENLHDHPILGNFIFADWQRNWTKSLPLPHNCVHGAIYLDDKGNIIHLQKDASVLPKCQILVMDGRIAAGLVDVIVPHLPRLSFYNRFLRPIIVLILKCVLLWSIFQWFFGNVYCLNVACLQPSSRGRVKLRQDGQGLDIDCQLAASEEDQEVLRNGLRTALAIARSSKGKHFKGLSFEVLPGPLFGYASSKAAFQRYLKTFLLTYFHPVGTCSMDHFDEVGEEVDGVVDSDLRLKTIDHLRIVDASVIPHIPSFPTAKTTMIIALIAAEKICIES